MGKDESTAAGCKGRCRGNCECVIGRCRNMLPIGCMRNADKCTDDEDKKRRPAFSRWSSFSHLIRTLLFTPPSLAAAESRRSGFRFVPCFSASKPSHGQHVRFHVTASCDELPSCFSSCSFLIMVGEQVSYSIQDPA